ncbi:MAG: MotA/TolQ/ExbB proton channel family protein [Nitrospirota bacterium]
MPQGLFQQGLDLFAHYVEVGGYVMPPLVAATLLLWFAIGYRALALRRGGVQPVRTLIDRQLKHPAETRTGIVEAAVGRGIGVYRRGTPSLRRALDDVFGEYDRDLKRFSLLIRIIVVAAPLLGLLGTVSGMIETFKSLEDMSLFSQSGGIAGGIAQALFTTQLGLAVAIPGLIIKGYLDKKQRTIQMELAQIKNILCTMAQRPQTPEVAA